MAVRAPLLAGAAALGASIAVAAIDPAERTVFPPCPFRTVTGLWCPGCGMTRALHQLLHGDVVGAVHLNALAVPTVVLAVVAWSAWLLGALGRRPAWLERVARPPLLAVVLAIAVSVGFAVLRNLPGVDGLRG